MSDPVPYHHDDLATFAVDLAPSGMLAVDHLGTIILVNREVERLFGWSREELIGRPIEELVPERFRGRHPGHRNLFYHDPNSRPMGAGRELYGLRRDGTEFPVEIGLNPVRLGDSLIVFASVVDITARRTLEESMNRSQKLEAVGVLAGGIAHDFNNILLGIVGHTELALRETGDNPQVKDDLGQVLKAADRGRQLVQRILAFSRKTELTRVPLKLEPTIREALALLRASLPRTIDIQAIIDPGTPTVLSDETQIHQILMNLATNAAHAMPTGGTLTVSAEPFQVTPAFVETRPDLKPGPYARLTIGDTGAGMTQDVLDHVFEPFFTTKPPGQGTGLGLSVIHGIVRNSGGLVEITSAPGRGTSVHIYLPAADSVHAGNGTQSEPGDPRRKRVLLVEDEEILAEMQRRQLKYLGFDVTVHTSSLEALDDFRKRPDAFDLMITDDTMPRMTGSMLAREILALRPNLPVLMVSGGDKSDPEKILAIGIRKILRKPHNSSELENAIQEVLSESK